MRALVAALKQGWPDLRNRWWDDIAKKVLEGLAIITVLWIVLQDRSAIEKVALSALAAVFGLYILRTIPFIYPAWRFERERTHRSSSIGKRELYIDSLSLEKSRLERVLAVKLRYPIDAERRIASARVGAVTMPGSWASWQQGHWQGPVLPFAGEPKADEIYYHWRPGFIPPDQREKAEEQRVLGKLLTLDNLRREHRELTRLENNWKSEVLILHSKIAAIDDHIDRLRTDVDTPSAITDWLRFEDHPELADLDLSHYP